MKFLNMLTFLAKRLSGMIPMLIGITFISFLIMHLAPGSPTDLATDLNPKVSEIAKGKAHQALRPGQASSGAVLELAQAHVRSGFRPELRAGRQAGSGQDSRKASGHRHHKPFKPFRGAGHSSAHRRVQRHTPGIAVRPGHHGVRFRGLCRAHLLAGSFGHDPFRRELRLASHKRHKIHDPRRHGPHGAAFGLCPATCFCRFCFRRLPAWPA